MGRETGGAALVGQMAPIALVPLPAPCFKQEGSIKTIGSGAPPPTPFSHPTPSFTSPLPQLMSISCHPAIFATISNAVQKFRADSANWPEFKRKWQERLGLLQASGPVDDKILLAQFLDCMDNVTKSPNGLQMRTCHTSKSLTRSICNFREP